MTGTTMSDELDRMIANTRGEPPWLGAAKGFAKYFREREERLAKEEIKLALKWKDEEQDLRRRREVMKELGVKKWGDIELK